MRRKLFVALLVVVTVFSTTSVSLNEVLANTSKSELNSQKKELDKQQSELNSQINEAENEVDSIETKIDQLNQEIKQLDLAVAKTGSDIREQEAEIKGTEEEIALTQAEIKVVEERIAERNELLKERARSLQASGGLVQYLEVLLGSQSFSDFIDRATAVTTFYNADREIIEQHEADKALIEKKKADLEALLEDLGTRLADLETLLAQQQSQSKEKESLIGKLEIEQQQRQEELYEIEDEAALIAAEKAAVVKELARIKQAEEDAKKQQQSGQTTTSVPAVSGDFIRPAAGPITSEYGQRWGRLHAGIDMGKRGSSVPIVATAAGTVSSSRYSSSYGNVVYLVSSVNGQMWTTVYAHMESRTVTTGQTVKQGQIIGYMGNTGRSTGPHLHFEMHKGGWSKSNTVNPRNYINF